MAEPHIDPAIFFSDHISTENNKPPPKMISATTQPAYIGQKEEAESSPLTNVLHRSVESFLLLTDAAHRSLNDAAHRSATNAAHRSATDVLHRSATDVLHRSEGGSSPLTDASSLAPNVTPSLFSVLPYVLSSIPVALGSAQERGKVGDRLGTVFPCCQLAQTRLCGLSLATRYERGALALST
ncbi:hypothetical protein PCANC_17732 [Puccinia coronata f. sp. avenae]|uniref:Uncharacterized protein n=1 Tax=Puccinia coronata f. sp. avenae TaxID=200324 RepID=A0A2N5U0V2_9BASI|nr:hypothetical protein PCANC_17732 [Puccinia coronata f. sp. avenae]